MPFDQTTMTIKEIRAAVCETLIADGQHTVYGGFDRLEETSQNVALSSRVNGTIFAAIGEALTAIGIPGRFVTVGEVMCGLGVHDPKAMLEGAHDIGFYCQGDVTGARAVRTIGALP